MYSIIEMQTTDTSTSIVTPIQQDAVYANALSKWHSICAAAAISTVPVHVVLLLDSHGNTLERGEFPHESA